MPKFIISEEAGPFPEITDEMKKAYSNMTVETIESTMSIIFLKARRSGRKYRVYTGVGGADKFDEHMEKAVGLVRVYIGKKVPRLLRSLNFKIKKTRGGRYYKLVKL